MPLPQARLMTTRDDLDFAEALHRIVVVNACYDGLGGASIPVHMRKICKRSLEADDDHDLVRKWADTLTYKRWVVKHPPGRPSRMPGRFGLERRNPESQAKAGPVGSETIF